MKTFLKKFILHKTKKAFSLAELVLSIGIFALVISSVSMFALNSVKATHNNSQRIKASARLQEVLNSLLITKEDSWSVIVQNTGSGQKHLEFLNNRYTISNGTETVDGITTGFTVDPVYRDNSGNIVETGGTLDTHSRAINFTSTWTDNFGGTKSVNSKIYINDWSTLKWSQTTEAEFNLGVHNLTVAVNNLGGELRLESVLYADWCRPTNTAYNFDVPGQGNPTAISAIANNAVIGTGGNASGRPFADISISNDQPPVIVEEGSFSGYKTNGIFREQNYAYLATDTNDSEIVILNITNAPIYSGKFDAPGNGAGNSITVANNVGYMTSSNKLYNFDLSSKTGARLPLFKNPDNTAKALTLSGTGRKISIVGNYAFIAANSTTNQLQIVDITNPANLTIIGQFTVNGKEATDLYVKSDGTRVYLVTEVSSTQSEFWVLDTSTKSSISQVSSYESNGMDPKGVTIIEGDNRAILVGQNAEEYQVLNISTETTLIRCGGLNLDSGINGVVGVTQTNNNNYSYLITGESSAEFKVIRGGPGGRGASNGQGYSETGFFESQIFNSGDSDSQYYSFDKTSNIPTSTDLKLQFRSSTTLAGIDSTPWVGPDGTASTFFTNSSSNDLTNLSQLQNKQYIQFKAVFDSDTISTPLLEEINIYYQK